MDNTTRNFIFELIDGTISPSDFERLQDALEQDPEVRLEYLRAVHLCQSLSDLATLSADTEPAATPTPAIEARSSLTKGAEPPIWRFSLLQWSVAVVALLVVSLLGFWLGQQNNQLHPGSVASSNNRTSASPEPVLSGHATLRRAFGLTWSDGIAEYREGDVLPNGLIAFEEGVAEIDFFCGATLIVEGPASLEVESDWSVRVLEGGLRTSVPPAARGFVVKAADSEIIDLGTEFAVHVAADSAHVEVLDGEVELRGGTHHGQHLVTGESRSLKGRDPAPENIGGVRTVDELLRRRDDDEAERFAEWQTFAGDLAQDNRLIAYYPIGLSSNGRVVSNASTTGLERDGHIIGPVQHVPGRFGAVSTGLEFERPGARVRTRIDGEFQAFTFACWVRIDSLEHRYNALFMGDGYENGEPHWQIRDDGRLMFSVMVDDSQEIRHFSSLEQRVVTDAGLHRVYITEPFWDMSKAGQWFHLAAVYDPQARLVTQYVNGEEIGREEIVDKFHTSTLRIGPAEIGNWGQPFRKSPEFAVRNLNGTIDELAIFGEALGAAEIVSLYNEGKPLGY